MSRFETTDKSQAGAAARSAPDGSSSGWTGPCATKSRTAFRSAISSGDVVDLRRRYGHRLGWCGNRDNLAWEAGDPVRIRREVLRRLNAARGGGCIFQSDHSVCSAVSGQTYDAIVRLVREYGRYPLELGEYTETV